MNIINELTQGELMFYGGIGLCALSFVSGLIFGIAFAIERRRIIKKIDKDYEDE